MVWKVVAEIIIHNASVQDNGKKITNLLEVTPELKPFLKTNLFWVEYDRSIADVPMSILNIPALSTVIHFALAVGVDVIMSEVDSRYLEGIEQTKKLLKYHPGFDGLNLKSTVKANPVENNFPDMDGKGLLFSGGVDSTASYIAHKHEDPALIFIHGIDMPLGWKEYYNRVVEHYKPLNLRTMASNTEEIYGNSLQWFGSKIMEGYMPGYSFSMNRLGLCAPLTVAEGIGELMMSSTYPSREYGDPNYPWSKNRVNRFIDQYLSWANVDVHDVEEDYTCTDKIVKLIKPHFEEHGPTTIRSCGHVRYLGEVNTTQFNCCQCDKCQRVIGALAACGIDPRTCGFPTTPQTYRKMLFDTSKGVWNPIYLKYHWSEVQPYIPDEIEEDYGGSRQFLEWLRGHRFD